MLEWLESFLGVYGYLVVGLPVALESMGVPLPGETVLLAAAAYAGAGERLNVAGVIGCAAAGAIVGDTVGYWLGRFGGLPLLERYGPGSSSGLRSVRSVIGGVAGEPVHRTAPGVGCPSFAGRTLDQGPLGGRDRDA